jgi:hypothetical protein
MSYELARKNVPGSPFSIRAITYIVSDQYHLMTLPNRLGFTLLSVMIDPEQRVLGCRAEKTVAPSRLAQKTVSASFPETLGRARL